MHFPSGEIKKKENKSKITREKEPHSKKIYIYWTKLKTMLPKLQNQDMCEGVVSTYSPKSKQTERKGMEGKKRSGRRG